MDTRRLRYFLRIAEAGSISRAAAQIGVAQPALSQQLAVLEHELGVRLFERTHLGVKLTAAGQTLRARARTVLRDLDDLSAEVRGQSDAVAGSVTVGLSPTIGPTFGIEFLARMLARHERVRLRLAESGAIGLAEALAQGRIDLIVTGAPSTSVGIQSIPLYVERLFVFTATSQPPPPTDLKGMAELPWIVTSSPNAIRDLLEAVFTQAGLRPNIAAQVDSLPLVIAAVEAGLGASLMSLAAVRDALVRGAVRASALGRTTPERTLHLHRRAGAASAATEAAAAVLLEIAREHAHPLAP